MSKDTHLIQKGAEVQALLNKVETLAANQTPSQGQETAKLETLSINGVVYTIDTKSAEKESYQSLTELRRTGRLVPGKSYRITDYVATTVQAGTQSANHPFDIVVVAISESELSEDARACLHEGDTYFSAAGANLSAWKLSYCIDNDTQRFSWADTINGKGVIYRLKDEWENDLPYDFKNIQFKRFYVDSVSSVYMTPLLGLPIALPETGSFGLVANLNYKWYYTFSAMGSSWDDEVSDGSISKTMKAYKNEIIMSYGSTVRALNNNVFANGPVVHNFLLSFDGTTRNLTNTISGNARYEGDSIVDNSFFGTNVNVFTKSQFRRNTCVGVHRHIDYMTDDQDNTIFAYFDFAHSTFGHSCTNNILVSRLITSNVFSTNFYENFIYAQTAIQDVKFGIRFNNNNIILQALIGSTKIGPDFQNNQISGDYIQFVNIGIYVNNIQLTTISMGQCRLDNGISNCHFSGKFRGCVFESRLRYIRFVGGSDVYFFEGISVHGPLYGTSSTYLALDSPFFYIASGEARKHIDISGDGNGAIVALWTVGGDFYGIMKSNVNSEWVEIPYVARKLFWDRKLNFTDGQEVVNETLIFNRN